MKNSNFTTSKEGTWIIGLIEAFDLKEMISFVGYTLGIENFFEIYHSEIHHSP